MMIMHVGHHRNIKGIQTIYRYRYVKIYLDLLNLQGKFEIYLEFSSIKYLHNSENCADLVNQYLDVFCNLDTLVASFFCSSHTPTHTAT